jgi:drug/metabolite transporter (DMT)-like permease
MSPQYKTDKYENGKYKKRGPWLRLMAILLVVLGVLVMFMPDIVAIIFLILGNVAAMIGAALIAISYAIRRGTQDPRTRRFMGWLFLAGFIILGIGIYYWWYA